MAGNMTNMNGTSRTYNDANQLISDGTTTYTYNPNSNMLNNST